MSLATNTVSIARVIDLAARGYKDSASKALAQFSKEQSLSTEQQAAIQRILNKISFNDTSEVFARRKGKIFSVLANGVPKNLPDLPWEMACEVLSHLPARDVCQCSTLVCKQLSDDTIHYWEKLHDRISFNMQHEIYTSSMLEGNYQVRSWSLIDKKIVSISLEEDVIIQDIDCNKKPLIITPNQGDVQAFMLVKNKLYIVGSVNHSITIWNATTGESMGSLEGHTAPVYSLLSNKEILVSFSLDDSIKIWNLEDSTCLKTFQRPPNLAIPHCMVDETVFAHNNDNNKMQMWNANVESMELQREWAGHAGKVSEMIVAEGSLFSSSFDGTVCMWDLNALKQQQQPECMGVFSSNKPLLGFTISNGKLFAFRNDDVHTIWDIKTKTRKLFYKRNQTMPMVKDGKLFYKVATGIQVLDFTADHFKVFNEIAKEFEEAEKTQCPIPNSDAICRFYKMPESAQQEVYKELGKILWPLEDNTVERAMNAFLDDRKSTCAQKAQAIRNYVHKNSRSQQG